MKTAVELVIEARNESYYLRLLTKDRATRDMRIYVSRVNRSADLMEQLADELEGAIAAASRPQWSEEAAEK